MISLSAWAVNQLCDEAVAGSLLISYGVQKGGETFRIYMPDEPNDLFEIINDRHL